MHKLKYLMLCIGGLAILSACQKNPNFEELSLKPAAITSRSATANFKEYTTFYISDTIKKASDTPGDTIITGSDALKLVNAIVANMEANGYRRLVGYANRLNADIGISTLSLNVDVTQTVYYPGWWGGYYGGYWGGGYWGYPYYGYYYPYGTTYNYNIGTFVTTALDLKNANSNNSLVAIWTSYLAGYASDTKSVNVNYAVDGINQSFKQSPYFTNK